jgi:hypothetical protein
MELEPFDQPRRRRGRPPKPVREKSWEEKLRDLKEAIERGKKTGKRGRPA